MRKIFLIAVMLTMASATPSFAVELDCTGGSAGDFTVNTESGTLTTAQGESQIIEIADTDDTLKFKSTGWLGHSTPHAGYGNTEEVFFDVTIWRHTGRVQVIVDERLVTGLGQRLPPLVGSLRSPGSCALRGKRLF